MPRNPPTPEIARALEYAAYKLRLAADMIDYVRVQGEPTMQSARAINAAIMAALDVMRTGDVPH